MKFLYGISLNTACTGLALVLSFLNQAFLARHLVVAEYGNLAFWTTTMTVASMLLGEWLNRGSTYVIGRERADEAVTGNVLIYSLVLSSVLLLVAFLLAELNLIIFSGIASFQWLLLAGLVATATVQRAGLGILLGQDRLKPYAFVPVIFVAVYLAGNLLVLQFGHLDLVRVLGVWLTAMSLSAGAAFFAIFFGGIRFKGFDRAVFRKIVQVGTRGSLSLILIFLLLRSDIWLLKYMKGDSAVAVYKVATNFADVMQRLPNVVGVVLLAKVVRGLDEDARLSLSVAQSILLFSLVFSLFLALMGSSLIDIFFPAFPQAYDPLLWLLPGLVFLAFGSVLNTNLAGRGYPAVTFWAPGTALLLKVVLYFLLVPTMGLKGAALSTSISYALWALLATGYYLRVAGLRWRALVRPHFLAVIMRKSSPPSNQFR